MNTPFVRADMPINQLFRRHIMADMPMSPAYPQAGHRHRHQPEEARAGRASVWTTAQEELG